MDRNSLLQSTFEIVTWPEIQDYMTIDNFRENAILINEEPFVDIVGSKDYIIILLFLMQPSAGDKPDRMQSQRSYYNLLCTNRL